MDQGVRTAEMVWVAGGRSTMGSDRHYPEERPAHRIRVKGFWLDRTPVTNRQFGAFVESTGYRSDAERRPRPEDYPGVPEDRLVAGSAVFVCPTGDVDVTVPTWWQYVEGACWRAPEGPGSDVDDRLDHPVVHVSYRDAEAYASWAGKRLPTEAEWELAARVGLADETSWDDPTDVRRRANVWPADFPDVPRGASPGTTPVGSFEPLPVGAVDLIGNVWEWTQDWFDEGHAAASACCVRADPTGPQRHPENPLHRGGHLRVLKGGSYLCAPNYCARYRPASRIPQAEDSGASNVGLRCVVTALRGGTSP